MNARCAFSSCHSASGKRAGLVLEGETSDLHMLLVDKKPCEAPNLKLVDASGGDAALVNSWVWQKLVAPADAGGDVTANAAWGAPGSCGQSATGTYGQRMPASNPAGLAKESLDKVRAWICAGAPGR
jgi:hypothetical protein